MRWTDIAAARRRNEAASQTPDALVAASGLTRDETHTYRQDGRALVSVTQAIRAAGLMGDTSFYTADSATRGTAVHLMTEQIDQGTLEDALAPALAGYGDAYRRFIADHRPVWTLTEAMRADLALGYAGTIDRAGTLATYPRAGVLDVKSGGAAPWHRLQLSAYRRLVAADLSSPLIARYTLYLAADGTYRIDALPLDDREDWQTFQAALAVASWQRRYL